MVFYADEGVCPICGQESPTGFCYDCWNDDGSVGDLVSDIVNNRVSMRPLVPASKMVFPPKAVCFRDSAHIYFQGGNHEGGEGLTVTKRYARFISEEGRTFYFKKYSPPKDHPEYGGGWYWVGIYPGVNPRDPDPLESVQINPWGHFMPQVEAAYIN